MPINKAANFSIQNDQGTYTNLLPETIKRQVIDWNIGEAYGPYTLTLPSANWVNKQQTLALDGVAPEDLLMCVKVLEGTVQEMKDQNKAYNLLDPRIGIESLSNEVRFTCSNKVPNIDIKVQVAWTR